MPVRKFRSVDEIPPPPRGDVRDPAYWEAVRSLLAMTAALSPPRGRPGVYKYRSVEEANAARAEQEQGAGRRRARSGSCKDAPRGDVHHDGSGDPEP